MKTPTENRNLLWQLFLTFMKIGAFTFGGGWAMISIIQREVVDKHCWISNEEFLDLLAVAQSLPGILAVNISVSVGDKLRGLRGSTAAALGTILPCFCIILGHTPRRSGADCGAGHHIGQGGQNRLVHRLDTCRGGFDDMVQDTLAFQPDTVYRAWRRGGMVAAAQL